MNLNEEKMVQALNFFACKREDGVIDLISALKSVYLADRWHLRMYGRTVTGDTYCAMAKGPVPSRTKEIADGKYKHPETSTYAKRFLQTLPKTSTHYQMIKTLAPFDEQVMSETDIEALEKAYDVAVKYGDLVAYTHHFPEWECHKAALKRGKRVLKMPIRDFFKTVSKDGVEYCEADASRIEASRWLATENTAIRSLLH